MEQQRTSPYLQPYFVARVYAALGENAEALDWLEKGDADRSEYLLLVDLRGLRTDPAWDGLQNELRYWQLCERLGLGKTNGPGQNRLAIALAPGQAKQRPHPHKRSKGHETSCCQRGSNPSQEGVSYLLFS